MDCSTPLQNSSLQPLIEMFADEFIIGELWVIAADAVNFLSLTERERFIRVETPDAFEQSLAPKHFVNPRNAAGETIRGGEGKNNGTNEMFYP